MTVLNADPSTPGLLMSLAAALPGTPLSRRAERCAKKLCRGRVTRALANEAADLLCDLLTAADADLSGYDDPDCLCADFDA